ncbi:bifunctional proline dehydrogenase/L-glutamate gamma-semialdehyde dehydrogenase PutA [Paraferrimonas sp. SM1919]|uniref:bifunctional proline dehydrogenase/L-glutamate gamma-semialdehyde dehydrogenase PutA n=1 Tax=Paraferrimonas sp. SM1919 TaxID=2662263 RepID=UPI0013D6ED34|nr:bifunctional proline dehydrogenase/L-glutamate gamma-semialdehyde dehydrogenase PutA [Paraferrimonas sp. SM1919]
MFTVNQLVNQKPGEITLATLMSTISDYYDIDESNCIEQLQHQLDADQSAIDQVTEEAHLLIAKVRGYEKKGIMVGVDAFLQEYSLDTQEGIILMCLAEALLRIPDAATADALIQDKLSGANWDKHLKSSDSLLVNASTWGLMLTGKIINLDNGTEDKPSSLLAKLVNRAGEPVIRNAMYAAMKIMGKQFVLGRTIKEAMKNSQDNRKTGYTHSYDMLGEAALSADDATKYFNDYLRAIETLGQGNYDLNEAPRPTISIKLSALHPRYEVANKDRVLNELYQSVISLINAARRNDIGIQIDAEEADRLELSLELFEKLYRSEETKGWNLLGLVVQAYSKRCLPVLAWVNTLAAEVGDEIPLRLVKGAYWDSEIKWSQEQGLASYPVFTRKASTDVSYLACAKFLLSDATKGNIYPQFATHNAHTVAAVRSLAAGRLFEFQRLHGMGQELYDTLLNQDPRQRVRIYAPVGAHKELLPYLVRRLLENGANTSFVYKLVDANTPIESLTAHPLDQLATAPTLHNNKIPLAKDIFGEQRINSAGINMNIQSQAQPFFDSVDAFTDKQWQGHSIINGQSVAGSQEIEVTSPFDCRKVVGKVSFADKAQVTNAITTAHDAFSAWCRSDVNDRAQMLQKLADLLEENRAELISLLTQEAGKSLQDGIDEIREAVDFCRYYAVQAKKMMAKPELLTGPTGELNELHLQGRGVFVCISPWNFPLAIFLGQISAALVAGNTVVAKPAEQTSLVAVRTIELAFEAGIPANVLQLVLGTGKEIGHTLTADERIAGICFTGSTATAKAINLTIAQREGAIIPLIAETGGQNAMVVDSTSLPEQVVNDVVKSSFTSAGQRCSALRVLYLQDDIADRVIELLKGAMQELTIGDPASYKTDVGPVIDQNAKQNLELHQQFLASSAKVLHKMELPEHCQHGSFVVPMAAQINSISELSKEHFGPILHIIRYQAGELDQVISDINSTGYGLTLGIHSRNEGHALKVADKVDAGNIYINRNQIGAVVGVQPFGGQGLSGTGPKAGGPHYLSRFVTEKTFSNNITAIGGNASLLILGDG